jgi:hypothetical protein
MASYTPSHTANACPSTGTSWSAVPTLPPTPYRRLCACMMDSLSCIANSSVTSSFSTSDYSSTFQSVCSSDPDVCAGISSNGTTGTYGAFAACNSTELLSWALNQYYQHQNKVASACDANGTAMLVTPMKNLDSDCSIMLAEAGSAGTATLTTTPTPTGTAAQGLSSRIFSSSGPATGTSQATNAASSDSSSGLSTSAKAGIGVAAALVALIFLLLGALFLLRRIKKKRRAAEAAAATASMEKPELEGTGVAGAPRRVSYNPELDSDGPGVNELPAVNREPAELHGDHTRELDGTAYGEMSGVSSPTSTPAVPSTTRPRRPVGG